VQAPAQAFAPTSRREDETVTPGAYEFAMTITRRTLLVGAGALALPAISPSAAPASDGFTRLEALDLGGGRLGYTVDGISREIRLPRGQELKVRLVNRLDRPTSVHWRGVRGPNAMDGVAPLVQKPVEPGGSFDYRFTPPDAGLFLFHAHAEPDFASQVERGLAGLLVVEDPAAPPVDHEFVVALSEQARPEACPGVFAHTAGEIAGADRGGVAIAVNGAPAPWARTAAPGARVRMRFANLTTGRLLHLAIEGVQSYVVAVDGQPCAPFEPLRNVVPCPPGARFDLVFDMPRTAGEKVRALLSGAPGEDILAFTAEGAAVEARPPVASAAANQLLPEVIHLQKARRMELVLDATTPGDPASCPDGAPSIWRINGKPAGAAPLFSVRRGAPVSLAFVNKSAAHVVMRLHGHVMRQLHALDDGWDPYWRDAVVVPAGRTVRVAFVADNPGRWRIGAGVLPHATGGLATFFDVT